MERLYKVLGSREKKFCTIFLAESEAKKIYFVKTSDVRRAVVIIFTI